MSKCEHDWVTEDVDMTDFIEIGLSDYERSYCTKCDKWSNNSSDWDILMGEV